MASLLDRLLVAGQIIDLVNRLEDLEQGDAEEIPVTRIRLKRKRFRLGPTPVVREA